MRTGSKILTKRLKGDNIKQYYGNPDMIRFKDLRSLYPTIDWVDPQEVYRLRINQSYVVYLLSKVLTLLLTILITDVNVEVKVLQRKRRKRVMIRRRRNEDKESNSCRCCYCIKGIVNSFIKLNIMIYGVKPDTCTTLAL